MQRKWREQPRIGDQLVELVRETLSKEAQRVIDLFKELDDNSDGVISRAVRRAPCHTIQSPSTTHQSALMITRL